MGCERCEPKGLNVLYEDRHFNAVDHNGLVHQVMYNDEDITMRTDEVYDPIVGADGWAVLFAEPIALCECNNIVREVVHGNVKVVLKEAG